MPKLKPSNVIVPEKHTTKTGKSYDKWWFDTCLISDLTLRAKVRSKTFEGIAEAFATQYTEFINSGMPLLEWELNKLL